MPNLVLSDLRVCDFTWVGAGSFATKILADFGAEVIKIETSTRPDVLRFTPPFKDGKSGLNRSGYFSNRNTNKKSVAINLKTERGREIALQLVAKSDLVANNFSPGTMERLGLGYEDCKRVRPDIIYLSMPMHGSTGPHRNFVGFGSTIGALTGFLDLTRFPGGPPLGTGTNYPDHIPNPAHAVVALLAALRHRRRTGEGQYIELSQVESMAATLGPSIVKVLEDGETPLPLGNRHPEYAPQGIYPCREDDRWIAISCRTDDEWLALAQLAAQGWTAEAKFQSMESRRLHADQLDALIAAWTETQPGLQLEAELQKRGIPAGCVQTPADLLEDPQLQHLGHWLELDHPEMGLTIYDGPAFHLSDTPAMIEQGAPLLGEHTREIMSRLIGLDDEEIDQLIDAGVLV